jgi:hypothetical protein
MALKKGPIALSLLATLALLFGSWFVYEKMEVENPILEHIRSMKSVNLVSFENERDTLRVTFDIQHPNQFPNEYRQLQNLLQRVAPNKAAVVELDGKDKDLDATWEKALFPLTEVMQLHQYSRIPGILEELKKTQQLEQAMAKMDDENVYIYLKKGDEERFEILPRVQMTQTDQEVTAHG